MPEAKPSSLRIVIELEGRLEELDLMDQLTDRWLDFLGVGEDQRDRLALAIREACANAIVHGNRDNPGGRITIELSRGNSELVIRVKDQGEGFDLEKMRDPLAPENLMRSSGRGILLMRAFMDRVDFNFGDGTLVTMTKALAGNATKGD